MAETNQQAPDHVATLQTMFPHIPEPALRRALEVSGTPDLAATLLLENPWQAFMPEQQQAPPPQDDDDDDEDEEPSPPPAPAEPARKRRKVTKDDKPPNQGDAAYDCLFDDVRTKKSSLQLMNLGPKKLAHTRVALLHSGAKDTYDGAGGYWLVPLSLQDLDETWWKVLTPHLERKSLGRAVEFRSLPEGPNMPDVAFDDLEAAQTRRANRPRAPRRAGAPAESAAIVAALVADRGEFPVRHTRSADRTRAMRRVNDCLVSETANLLQGIVQQPGNFLLAFGIEIGSPDIADKQRIAGEDANRSFGIFAVMDNKGEMVVSVTGRFEHFDSQLSQFKAIAFARSLGKHDFACWIGPVIDPRAGHFGKDRRSADEVLIAMGLEDMRYPQPLVSCSFNVDIAISARIDDGSHSAGSDKIGEV